MKLQFRQQPFQAEAVVYTKLPKVFAISTPVGDYNPDWAYDVVRTCQDLLDIVTGGR